MSTEARIREEVVWSVSRNHTDGFASRSVPYDPVVFPNDPNGSTRLATDEDDTVMAELVLYRPCTSADLRTMGYPNVETLRDLGRRAISSPFS